MWPFFRTEPTSADTSAGAISPWSRLLRQLGVNAVGTVSKAGLLTVIAAHSCARLEGYSVDIALIIIVRGPPIVDSSLRRAALSERRRYHDPVSYTHLRAHETRHD